ncbi:MAG TPA: curli assembly protein CsgG [Verrucomicrobia bacterium]|nr:MAG: hypothetical protein A2X46_10905 [Lentisphaerae bacterium GWF2_57_35]HBA86307.1 curli assembly protein CsgG [Verrucomicrobiota bacterium]
MKKVLMFILALVPLLVFGGQDAPAAYPAAVFPFQERGAGVKGYGEKISDILFASLSANPDMYLVDRADIQKLLEEHELNLSGMVTPGQETKIGQLTGAKILVTGSVIEADKTLYIVAKIIGTETSRVLGESVKGNMSGELAPLVEDLAKRVAATVSSKAGELVSKTVKTEDRIAALSTQLGEAKRPTVVISVTEQHVGLPAIDPAAQTELTMFCKETGFDVIDPVQGSARQAAVRIEGEGFSEFGMRRGNLVSVKARLEVKAVDVASGKILAVDRQNAIIVDLTEQIAGKAALQDAAASIAERLLPKLVK